MKILTVVLVSLHLFTFLNGAPLQQNYLSHQIFEDKEEKGAALNKVVSFCYQFVNYFMLFMYYQPLLERLHSEFVKVFGKTTTRAPKVMPQYEYYDSIETTTKQRRRHRHKRRRKHKTDLLNDPNSTSPTEVFINDDSMWVLEPNQTVNADTFSGESNRTVWVNQSDSNTISEITSNITTESFSVAPKKLYSPSVRDPAKSTTVKTRICT